MKMLFKMGSTILTLAFMTACGNGVNLSDRSNLDGTLSFAGAKQGMKGIFGKNFNKGDKGAFAQDFLNLTDEQKTKLKELRDSLFVKPEQTTTKPDMATMKANAEAVKTAFKEAFLSDTMDVTALKAKLESLKPAKPAIDTDAHLKAQAEYILKSYQILTAEQKQTLETKKAEMDAKRTEMEASRPAKP
ncbi:MAG: Spy/CpxP family protein refolding chaperone, partial [Candidatus Sericytochromatia bacterium]